MPNMKNTDPSRKFSRTDDRMLRENEYIGRVLNEKVKELDKLKTKFEKKLQLEKEKFAVQHLTVTSSFNQKKGTRKKKISLAFDDAGKRFEGLSLARNRPSKSESELTSQETQESEEKCMFPPLVNDFKNRGNRKYSRSFSEGVRIEREGIANGTLNLEDTATDLQRPLVADDSKRERRRSRYSQSSGHITNFSDPRSWSSTGNGESLLGLTEIIAEENLPDWQREIIEANRQEKSNNSTETVSSDHLEKLTVDSKSKQTRTRKTSRMSKCEDVSTGLDQNHPDTTIDVDNITRVNMVKNLTKQQRFDMEHQVTFLPPMNRMFKEDPVCDSNENEKDMKRLSMAKKRWMKAYNLAKENFQGIGPKDHTNPIEKAKEEQQTQNSCSQDPRLLRLVSLLSKRQSISVRTDMDT